jgi:hypothetical protein
MTTELWTYRVEIFEPTPDMDAVRDLTGFKVEARDGSIGKIDEATGEAGRSFVVVDTGPWIFGRKVMIPAGAIERIDRDERKVYLNLTKDQIKDAPEFDPERDDTDDYRDRLGTYYRERGWAA